MLHGVNANLTWSIGKHNTLKRATTLQSFLLAQRKLVRVLDLAEDEERVERADAVKVAKNPEHEFLVGFHVGNVDFEHEVVVAADVVALHNFRNLLHSLHDTVRVLVGMLLHPEVTEGDEAAVYLLGIQYSHVFLDVTFAFKAFHAFECGSGREVNLCR